MIHFIRCLKEYTLLGFLVFSGLWVGISVAQIGQLDGNTNRVSIGNDGQQGNGNSQDSAISDDGRYIVFESEADNLVPGDYNQSFDVFVYNVETEVLGGITVGGNWGGYDPEISADGRYIAFWSNSNNLVANDTNDEPDIFVYDQQTGSFEIVSLGFNSEPSDGGSFGPIDISTDGRFVAFGSYATNLVPGVHNYYMDTYVRDRQLGVNEKVSVDSDGNEANYHSGLPTISADGRYIAFSSEASNLVGNDTNNYADVFLHDRQSGLTQRLSESLSGEQGYADSNFPSISDDGRYVAFHSGVAHLVNNDTNQTFDIFVRDLWLNVIERVSLSSSGAEANGGSGVPTLSGDGRFVTFISYATNLAEQDNNEAMDIFVHDRQTGLTERVNVNDEGEEALGWSYVPGVSLDGALVTFTSSAPNLVVGDTNEWDDVFVREVWWPAGTISQTVGAVGSYFGVVVSHFPANSPLDLTINGQEVGEGLMTDENGGLALELETTEADPGYYRVRLGAGVYWREVAFSLTETGVVYPGLGGRPVVGVPAGIAQQRLFLPLLLR